MIKKITTIVFLLLTLPALANDTLSSQEFTELYVQEAVKLDNTMSYHITKPLEVEFTTGDGEKRIAYLDNAYSEYRLSPKDAKAIIKNYLTSFRELLSATDQHYTKEQVFPVIKDQRYLQQITELFKQQKPDEEPPFVYEKLNKVLYVFYAFDTEHSIRFLKTEDLDELGLKRTELLALAKKNLKRALPSIKTDGDVSTLSMLIADGTYEASFLLFDGIWTRKNFPVKGDIVVYVPTRDLVLITGSKDKNGIKKIHEIVYDPEVQWPHSITDTGFVRRNNRWEVFKP